ncbi:MAG TPA: restriction endonuclease subunit S [Phycisphaerae bacterium]|nr:restriction endonuclease subunit S [Phycisphaerae bacterium]HRR87111.1 restriction endonuclease subunit S [Phycisphaerae bacterium]
MYNRLFAWKGSFALAPNDSHGCYVSNEFPCFQVNPDRLDGMFLWRYLSQEPVWTEALGLSTGGTPTSRNRLKEEKLLQMTIPLPPLSEQRRIVAKIDQLAAKIEEARELRSTLEDEGDVLVRAETHRLFHVEQDRPPVGWSMAAVGDLGPKGAETVQTGPFGAQLHKSDFVPEGRPVLAIGNVQWGYLDTRTIDHVTEAKAAELARYILADGDVLFTRSGTVGRSAVVPADADGWLMTGHILRIRLNRTRCEPQFLFHGFRGSRDMQEQVEGSIPGATRAGFNTALLSGVRLPLPPIPEQRRIVEYLDGLQAKVDRLKELQAATAAGSRKASNYPGRQKSQDELSVIVG